MRTVPGKFLVQFLFCVKMGRFFVKGPLAEQIKGGLGRPVVFCKVLDDEDEPEMSRQAMRLKAEARHILGLRNLTYRYIQYVFYSIYIL